MFPLWESSTVVGLQPSRRTVTTPVCSVIALFFLVVYLQLWRKTG